MNAAAGYRHAKEYLDFCRLAFEMTAAGRRVQLHWNGPELDAAGWRREFLRALNNRINRKGGIECRSRCCPSDLMSWANHSGSVRDQRRLQDIRNRVCVYQFETRAVRERFSHLLSQRESA